MRVPKELVGKANGLPITPESGVNNRRIFGSRRSATIKESAKRFLKISPEEREEYKEEIPLYHISTDEEFFGELEKPELRCKQVIYEINPRDYLNFEFLQCLNPLIQAEFHSVWRELNMIESFVEVIVTQLENGRPTRKARRSLYSLIESLERKPINPFGTYILRRYAKRAYDWVQLAIRFRTIMLGTSSH